MPYTFRNFTPAAGDNAAVSWVELKALLKAQGWTVPASSDGITFAEGDVITNASQAYKAAAPSLGVQLNTIAGSLDNNLAWMVLRSPGAFPREICIQRGSRVVHNYDPNPTSDFRVKYSPGGLFSADTTATITKTPYAADEYVFNPSSWGGTNTDASPRFDTMLPGKGLASRVHLVAGDITEGFPFALIAYTMGTENALVGGAMQPGSHIDTAFFLDITRQPPDGSLDPTDPDPAVLGLSTLGTDQLRSLNPIGMIGSAVVPLQMLTLGDAEPVKLSYDSSQVTTMSPIAWGRGGSSFADPKGFKGFSTMLYALSVFLWAKTTLNFEGSATRIVHGYVSTPWDGSSPLYVPTLTPNVAAQLISPFPPPVPVYDEAQTPDVFSVDAGVDAGGIVPLPSDAPVPFEGARAMCLGHDTPGFTGFLNVGDYVEITQVARFKDAKAVTFTPRLRPPKNTPGGLAWKASILIDDVERSSRIFRGKVPQDLSTWTLNVSKLTSIDHRLSFRLTLIATS
jgi:hypothetical protein